MQPQLNNHVISSLKLYLENKILTKGQAFTNHSGLFYPVQNNYSNLYTYALPFQPIIADQSIPGATIMSGVYLDNVYIQTGQSGLFNINYEKGEIYFTSGVNSNRLSGNYSFADYNVKLTADSDATLLLQNKYFVKSKVNQTISGVQPYELTYPVIYIRENGGKNKGLAFGGLSTTSINVRLVTIADSAFLLDATNSILKDLCETYVPLLSGHEFPFDGYGGLHSGTFSYTGMVYSKIPNNAGFISYLDINKFLQNVKTDTKILPNNVFISFADMGIEVYRYPHA